MREMRRSYHTEVLLDETNEARGDLEYLSILQKRAPVTEQYDPEAQWAKLEEEHPVAFEEDDIPMTRLFRALQRKSLRGVRHRTRMIARGAEIAAAMIVLSTVTANALGFHPIHAILQWAEGIVQIYTESSGTMELPDDDPSEYRSLAEALEGNCIDADGLPTWVPQDYAINSVTAKSSDSVIKCVAAFESDRGNLTMRVTAYSMENVAVTEERDETSTCYSKNGVDYYIISNYNQIKIGWQIGLNTYVIGGQITEDEAEKIINSIT